LQSAIATGLSWLKPLPWAGSLQSVIAICSCNRAILAPIPSWAGRLQSVIAICNCNRAGLALIHPWAGGLQSVIAICNCNRAGFAPILSWAGSLQSVIAICNCNRVTLQLQPGICNCSRASAIVTENAHAHMQLELRLSISIIPVGYTILCIQTVGGVGWGACCRPLRGRLGRSFFINLLRHSSSLAARMSCLRRSAAR